MQLNGFEINQAADKSRDWPESFDARRHWREIVGGFGDEKR